LPTLLLRLSLGDAWRHRLAALAPSHPDQPTPESGVEGCLDEGREGPGPEVPQAQLCQPNPIDAQSKKTSAQ